jgi:hypothetical protein
LAGFFNLTNGLLEVPFLVNRTTFSCYYGVEELALVVGNYTTFASDLSTLSFNAFYNSGDIFTSLRNIFLYFMDSAFGRVQDATSFGKELGNVFFLVFYPQKENLELLAASGTANFK